jgi:hypothetical protein
MRNAGGKGFEVAAFPLHPASYHPASFPANYRSACIFFAHRYGDFLLESGKTAESYSFCGRLVHYPS